MKIKTSSALRDVDRWRERSSKSYRKLQYVLLLLLGMLGGSRKGMLLFAIIAPLPVLYLGPGILSCLIVLGIMNCRLGSYRLLNLFLSLITKIKSPFRLAL